MNGFRMAACSLFIAAGAAGAAGTASTAAPADEGVHPVSRASFLEQELQIRFASAMQAWDNPREGLVSLDPAVPVQCAWHGDTLISCRPDRAARFAPATRYRITLVPGLATQDGSRLPDQVLEAETDRPTLQASVMRWADGVPEIEVTSNIAVDAAEVARVLRLSVDGQVQPTPALGPLPPRGDWDRNVRFALELPQFDGSDRRVELRVGVGLRSSEGPLPGIQEGDLLATVVNEGFRVREVGCAGVREPVTVRNDDTRMLEVGCMPGERLGLLLSAAPDTASRAAFAEALPDNVRLDGWGQHWGAVAGGATVLDRGHLLNLHVDVARTEVDLGAAIARLRAVRGGAVIEPVALRVRTGDFRPALSAPRQRALFADATRLPVMAEAVNVGLPFAIQVTALGTGRQREEVVHVAASGTRNVPGAIASGLTTQVLQEGGWATWQLPDTGDYRRRLEFAAPGFELIAVSGRRELLVWASDWQDGVAIEGARIELLASGGVAGEEVVLRGLTDVHGVARLALPEEFGRDSREGSDSAPGWLLRAEAGRGQGFRRAVLPLHGNWSRGILGDDARLRLWGVSDRPLYKAGDIAHYQLWQRRSTGGRLRAVAEPAPLDIGLYSRDEGKLIKTWSVTPGANGAIAGTVALPVHLTDGTYCIGAGDPWEVEGSCFFVGTYRAQDLWVEATSSDRVLRHGDRFTAVIEAGYYSGGVAAGVSVPTVTTLLTGRDLGAEYPEYAGFTFVDVGGDDARNGIALAASEVGELETDAQGRLVIERLLEFVGEDPDRSPELPAFGELRLVAEARLADREGTSSNAARARYARHDHYVGLRLHPGWLDADTPVDVEAIVISAEGAMVEAAQVEIEVHFLPGFEDADAASGQALAHCVVAAGATVPCDFPRARSGRYRITARSGDAAAAELTRYVHVGDAVSPARNGAPALELVTGPAEPGDPLRVLLRQPHANARVLFVFSSGDAILGHQVEALAGGVGTWALQVPDTGARSAVLTAYVVAAVPAGVDGEYRVARPVSAPSVAFDLPRRPAAPPLALSLEADSARPGELARVTLRNDGPVARDVVLSVMDDALRALGREYLEYSDPEGSQWLGEPGTGYSRLALASFADWRTHGLELHLPWSTSGRPAAGESAPGGVLAGADGRPLPLKMLSPEEPPVVFDDPSPMSALPPPAPVASVGPALDASPAALDRIEVTGSRITPLDIFAPGGGPVHGLRPRESSGSAPARPLARARTRFTDTALWQSGIHLAPGEVHSIELLLPDNLTRWRAVAWSGDADDGFHMVEATLEAGLPLEVRLQAPVRLYPGDSARVAANVRQSGGAALVARGSLMVEGMGSTLSRDAEVPLPPRGQGSFALDLVPEEVGGLTVIASVDGAGERDAVAAPVEVASPRVVARRTQAGWLPTGELELHLPQLPPGASHTRLEVQLHRGIDALVSPWTRALRDYPHRCWEQVLSRAVAAALAIERGDTGDWPRARAVVQEALDNAAVFQDHEGGFHFFAGSDGGLPDVHGGATRVTLAAYTVRVFRLLRELGYPVPAHVDESARRFLKMDLPTGQQAPVHRDLIAFAEAANPTGGTRIRQSWAAWDALSLPARIATARVMASTGHPAAGEAIASLLAMAPRRGEARVLSQPRTHGQDPWMSSSLREQCALIELLGDHPRVATAEDRRQLITGLSDLYAGGPPSLDTQAGAQCLLALRTLAQPVADGEVAVSISLDGQPRRLAVPVGEHIATLALPLAPGTSAASPVTLRISPESISEAGSSYVAELRYEEDAREARPSAVGLLLDRRHEVLRNGAWRSLEAGGLREGDWVRVTMVVDSSATRHFVAVTDAVPGGLMPTDLALGGIAGLDLARVADEGSHWFRTRRLDPRAPKFYAEMLPAGRHEIHYFARAGNAGDYLAAPAVAELMYGDASHARTNAVRLRIGGGQD